MMVVYLSVDSIKRRHQDDGLGIFKSFGFICLITGDGESLLNYTVIMSYSFCVGELREKFIPKVIFPGHIHYFKIFEIFI